MSDEPTPERRPRLASLLLAFLNRVPAAWIVAATDHVPDAVYRAMCQAHDTWVRASDAVLTRARDWRRTARDGTSE